MLPHNFRFMPINKDNRVLNVLLCKQKGKRFANLSLRNGSYNIKCRSLPIAFICNVKHIYLLVNLKFWWIEFLNLPHFVCFNIFFLGFVISLNINVIYDLTLIIYFIVTKNILTNICFIFLDNFDKFWRSFYITDSLMP